MDRQVVAEGVTDEGLAWVIWARRDEPRPGDLLSMIKVTDPGGRILHAGGMAGPPLHTGYLLNITTGGSDEGPRVLIGRIDPTIRKLRLRAENATTLSVAIHDCEAIPEVRFAIALIPRDLPLASIAGYGRKGNILERFDLRFHQGRWEERYRDPRQDSAAG